MALAVLCCAGGHIWLEMVCDGAILAVCLLGLPTEMTSVTVSCGTAVGLGVDLAGGLATVAGGAVGGVGRLLVDNLFGTMPLERTGGAGFGGFLATAGGAGFFAVTG